MDKKLFRSLILLITYTVLLVLLLLNHRELGNLWSKLLVTCRPLIIGAVIAFVLNRPCGFFTRQFGKILPGKVSGAARPLAVLVSYILLLGAVTLLFSFIIPGLVESISTFVGSLSIYVGNLQDLYDWVVSKFDLETLSSVDFTGLSETIRKILNGALNAMTTAVPQLVNATAKLISGIVTTFLSVVFSVYLLANGPTLARQGRKLVSAYLPGKVSLYVLDVAKTAADTFTNFVTGQATEAVILGALCFAGMTIFRFAYAPLISVIVAVSALIPIAGAYIGAGIAFLLLVMIDPMQAVWFVVFLVVLQQLEGNIIYPRVVGTSIGLPGFWVLAAVTVGGGLFGFGGMLLGVPVTAVLYAMLREDVARRMPCETKKTPKEDEETE